MGLFTKKSESKVPKPLSYDRISKMPTEDVTSLMETASMHIGTSVDGVRGAKLEDKGYYFDQLSVYIETLQACSRVVYERFDVGEDDDPSVYK